MKFTDGITLNEHTNIIRPLSDFLKPFRAIVTTYIITIRGILRGNLLS